MGISPPTRKDLVSKMPLVAGGRVRMRCLQQQQQVDESLNYLITTLRRTPTHSISPSLPPRRIRAAAFHSLLAELPRSTLSSSPRCSSPARLSVHPSPADPGLSPPPTGTSKPFMLRCTISPEDENVTPTGRYSSDRVPRRAASSVQSVPLSRCRARPLLGKREGRGMTSRMTTKTRTNRWRTTVVDGMAVSAHPRRRLQMGRRAPPAHYQLR